MQYNSTDPEDQSPSSVVSVQRAEEIGARVGRGPETTMVCSPSKGPCPTDSVSFCKRRQCTNLRSQSLKVLRTVAAKDKPSIHFFARSFGQSTGTHPVLAGADTVLGGCGKTDLSPALLDLPFYWGRQGSVQTPD